MDSAMVKASTAVNQLGDALPGMASTPTLMEISPDMMATQYIAVDYDGMDIYELSDYVSENVLPQLERVDGVASVSTTGLVEKSVQITLDQERSTLSTTSCWLRSVTAWPMPKRAGCQQEKSTTA